MIGHDDGNDIDSLGQFPGSKCRPHGIRSGNARCRKRFQGDRGGDIRILAVPEDNHVGRKEWDAQV